MEQFIKNRFSVCKELFEKFKDDFESSTRIWREVDGKLIFRFQTYDEKLHQYMSQRNDFKLVGWGVNINLWIYRAEFSSIRAAQQALKVGSNAME